MVNAKLHSKFADVVQVAARNVHACDHCGSKYLIQWPACPECSAPNTQAKEGKTRHAEETGDERCVVCLKIIGDDDWKPLDDDRPDDGPKVHTSCVTAYECDRSPRCNWCFLTMEQHQLAAPSKEEASVPRKGPDGSSGWARDVPLPAVQGGAVGADAPTGPMLNFHEGCVEAYNELHGTKCVTCGRVVHLGLKLSDGRECHKGFCYEQALLKEREEMAIQYKCVACGEEIEDDFYEFGEVRPSYYPLGTPTGPATPAFATASLKERPSTSRENRTH